MALMIAAAVLMSLMSIGCQILWLIPGKVTGIDTPEERIALVVLAAGSAIIAGAFGFVAASLGAPISIA